MKNQRNHNSIFYLLCFLFAFLPFSSWLVSLSGLAWISLIRDVVIILMIVLLFVGKKIKPNNKIIFSIALLFVLWGLASFFWREASVSQWLKGFRFTFMPIILFLVLLATNYKEKEKAILSKVLLFSSGIIIIFSLLELFGIKIPLTTSFSGPGALESNHVVGKLDVSRLGSVLAGPNALGLYLLALTGYFLGSFGFLKKVNYLWIVYAGFLVLTFSRSAIVGLLVMILLAFFLLVKEKMNWLMGVICVMLLSVIFLSGGIFLYRNDQTKDYFTHSDSTSLRIEQYKRVWDSRGEIGLLGRGSGTAGPSSQLRLDGGENHWTENIYLDIFEELGLIGLILFIILIKSIAIIAWKNKDRSEGKTALMVILAFALAGLFINIYTGQAGLYLLILIAGLALGVSNEKNSN